MNKVIIFCLVLLISTQGVLSQSFAPAAGQLGSTAISKDSSIIVGWATNCIVDRGFIDIENPSLGYATFGSETDATGMASGISTSVVSLGDGGVATLTFETTIVNGIGPDFVVFENGVNDNFLELGFVEVSSDGINFIRFPSVTEIQDTAQVSGFGTVDCRYIHNFAGKYRIGYGTPFDLDDILDSNTIDINAISHVRIVDVVGSINPQYATHDSQGTVVNNLYPTPFESSGFDLDGVGIINRGELSIELKEMTTKLFPNPAERELTIQTNKKVNYTIHNLLGKKVLAGELQNGTNKIDIQSLETGFYIINTGNSNLLKFVKN